MADLPSPHPEDGLTLAPIGPVRNWEEGWRDFSHRHSHRVLFQSRTEPIYCLPMLAIQQLGRPLGSLGPLFSETETEMESEFSALCQVFPAIGVWGDQPVVFPFLQTPLPYPDPDLIHKAGWTPSQKAAAKKLAAKTQEISLRLKGYAGWLLTEPAFLKEVQQLASAWRTIPKNDRPGFPLGRFFQHPLLSQSRPLPSAIAQLETHFRAFLDRWGLTKMASWDLPQPQGPLWPNLIPPEAPAQPAPGLHLFLPLHYPLQGDDDLQRQIYDFQRQRVKELGLDESLAGLPHFKAYAAMLDVLHLERAIRARLPQTHIPRGVVTAMKGAIAAALGCSEDQVEKARKAISACRRGHRHQVAWLRLRNR